MGDQVGSWVRLACMHRLTDIVLASSVPKGSQDRQDLREFVMALLIKQSVERIDNIRASAGEQIIRLKPLSQPSDKWVTLKESTFFILNSVF